MISNSLFQAFQDLRDACDDFDQAGFQNAAGALARLVAMFAVEPLASLEQAVLPKVDFTAWWNRSMATQGMAGTAQFLWATDIAERAATQLALLRAIADGTFELEEVAATFCYTAGGHFTDMFALFSRQVLAPFVRDLRKLADRRVAPPVLQESLVVPLKPSGDLALDQLLATARDLFQDKNPVARRQALEKLWDAWERAKSLHDPNNKLASTQALLDAAASDPAFRAVLEDDARALTKIGNRFYIRHFETDKAPIVADAHVDYLFHRLWALLWLVLPTRP